MTILIKNGRVVDPGRNLDKKQDVFIQDGKITRVSNSIAEKANEVIDAQGKIVMPGIVDMHVHLREPGREDKETVFSGTRAGLKGGVTSVLAMPNTRPTIDSVKSVKLIKDIIKKTANANVFIAGAITIDRIGKALVNIGSIKKEGVIAITDDGCSVDSDEIFIKALKEAKKHKVLIICHCEDKNISRAGVMNLGLTSTILGLRGISSESEYRRVERNIKWAQKIGGRIHIAHVSCRQSVDMIAAAKKKGVLVTAETAPHYFCLDETELMDYNTNKKINPPLRTKEDVDAIKQGLKDGIIDVIASDHAPHTENEKDIEFDRAAFGTIGLETILSVSITELVKPGLLSWLDLSRVLSFCPANVLGLEAGTLKQGSCADIIVIDPDKERVVQKEDIVSKSKNSAFLSKKLKGRVDYTILKGKTVFKI